MAERTNEGITRRELFGEAGRALLRGSLVATGVSMLLTNAAAQERTLTASDPLTPTQALRHIMESQSTLIHFTKTRQAMPAKVEDMLEAIFKLNIAYKELNTTLNDASSRDDAWKIIEKLNRDCWDVCLSTYPELKNRGAYSYDKMATFLCTELPERMAEYGIVARNAKLLIKRGTEEPLTVFTTECTDIDLVGTHTIKLFGQKYTTPVVQLGENTTVHGITSETQSSDSLRGFTRFGTTFILADTVTSLAEPKTIEIDDELKPLIDPDVENRFDTVRRSKNNMGVDLALLSTLLRMQIALTKHDESSALGSITKDHEACHAVHLKYEKWVQDRFMNACPASWEEFDRTYTNYDVNMEIFAYNGELAVSRSPLSLGIMIRNAINSWLMEDTDLTAHVANRWIVDNLLDIIQRNPARYDIDLPSQAQTEEERKIAVALQLDEVLKHPTKLEEDLKNISARQREGINGDFSQRYQEALLARKSPIPEDARGNEVMQIGLVAAAIIGVHFWRRSARSAKQEENSKS